MKLLECECCEFIDECYDGDLCCGDDTCCNRCREMDVNTEEYLINGITEELCADCYELVRKNGEISTANKR